jgi:hypothetical protein
LLACLLAAKPLNRAVLEEDIRARVVTWVTTVYFTTNRKLAQGKKFAVSKRYTRPLR